MRKPDTATISAVMRNVYTGPAQRWLEEYLCGLVEVTALEIITSTTDEGAFVALLQARIISTLGDMAAVVMAPTFPVHDPPAPTKNPVWEIPVPPVWGSA